VKELTEAYDALQTGRLQATQIPGLLSLYEIRWLVIIAEKHQPNPHTGVLQVWRRTSEGWGWVDWIPGNKRRPIAWSYLFNFLGSPEFLRLGIGVVFLPNKQTVAHWIWAQYKLWSRPYASHKSMQTLDRSSERKIFDGSSTVTNSLGQKFNGLPEPLMNDERFRQRVAVAAAFPGIRYKRAIALAKEFDSVREMINPECTCGGGDPDVEEKRWAKADKMGKKTAKELGRAIR